MEMNGEVLSFTADLVNLDLDTKERVGELDNWGTI